VADRVVVQSSSGGIGVAGLLGVAFVVLKLTGYINWPWVWVLSPFWIPFVLILGILGFIAVAALIGWGISSLLKRRKRRR
jgi:hypothetical protein